MREMMPTLLTQLQNPDMQNLFTNPQALGAIQQIQQGLEALRISAPGLANTYVIIFLLIYLTLFLSLLLFK